MHLSDFSPTLLTGEAGSTRRTVLVIDAATGSRETLVRLLAADYGVVQAATGKAGLDAALRTPPDLILLEILLPGLNGYEVLQLLKADTRSAAIPVIVITGLRKPEDEERALRLGAADYIAKPYNPPVVRARVALQLSAAHDRQQLSDMARIDGLTGIANRRQFDAFLASECRRAVRNGQPLSVALIDVDFFKQFNDRYGHAMGDRALCAVAQVLKDGMRRPGDLAARYGGEEFALVMVDTDGPHAAIWVDHLRKAIQALAIPHEKSTAATELTISAGIACALPGTTPQPAPLLQLSDKRLYQSKAAGRNRVTGEG